MSTLFAVPIAHGQDKNPPPENLFSDEYNRWLELRARGVLEPGVINAKELSAWNRVEESWKVLRHHVRNLYG